MRDAMAVPNLKNERMRRRLVFVLIDNFKRKCLCNSLNLINMKLS
jgi:hypothetical protein